MPLRPPNMSRDHLLLRQKAFRIRAGLIAHSRFEVLVSRAARQPESKRDAHFASVLVSGRVVDLRLHPLNRDFGWREPSCGRIATIEAQSVGDRNNNLRVGDSSLARADL